MPLGFPDPNPTTPAGALGAAAAPTIAGDYLQYAQYEQQLGNLGPGLQQAQDQAAIEAGFNLGQLGIGAQQQALEQAGSQQNYALQQQSFQQQAQENQFNYQNQLQDIVGGAAASGVLSTAASRRQQGNLGQQAAFANQNLQRQVQQASGDYARAQQNFALMAKANGLSQQEVYTRLQEGLQQMGVNADPSQLIAQMGGTLSSANQAIAGVIMQAGLFGGINPSQGLTNG